MHGVTMKFMAHAFCVLDTEGCNTHWEYVIMPSTEQWLHERASVLRYAFIACLV